MCFVECLAQVVPMGCFSGVNADPLRIDGAAKVRRRVRSRYEFQKSVMKTVNLAAAQGVLSDSVNLASAQGILADILDRAQDVSNDQ